MYFIIPYKLSGWDILEIPNNYYQSNILETIEPSILADTGSMKWWLLWEGKGTQNKWWVYTVYIHADICIYLNVLCGSSTDCHWTFAIPTKTFMKSWNYMKLPFLLQLAPRPLLLTWRSEFCFVPAQKNIGSMGLVFIYLHLPSKSSKCRFLIPVPWILWEPGTLGGEPGATDSSWQRNFSLAGREMEGVVSRSP